MAGSLPDKTLTDDWQEISQSPMLAALLSGRAVWYHNGSVPPTNDNAKTIVSGVEDDLSFRYGGALTTYAKIAKGSRGTKTVISIVEV